MSHAVLINALYSVSTFTSVNLRDGVGMGTVFTGTGGDGVQFLFPCRPVVSMHQLRQYGVGYIMTRALSTSCVTFLLQILQSLFCII